MPEVMKTLLLNPPSFENFDGGASSRCPATREIESYWYPVWLTYPAGMIPGSRLLDASPHKINWKQTVEICKNYEFLILSMSSLVISVSSGLICPFGPTKAIFMPGLASLILRLSLLSLLCPPVEVY